MDAKQLSRSIAARWGVKDGGLRKTVNRAIRTLPGGNETLDAIEAINAAILHAEQHGAAERVVANRSALLRVESIRQAMEDHVIECYDAGA